MPNGRGAGDSSETRDDNAALRRGIRSDLIIALCALLISTLATGATWWQARILATQTGVLQEQLGAQVWPYVGISENAYNDRVGIVLENDGLGPAIIRSATAKVDGAPQRSMIDVMHAILGPNLIARSPHGEKIGLTLNSDSPGSVLRQGASTVAFELRSKRFAPPLYRGLSRVAFRLCYCAIIPGKCWFADTKSSDPRPVRFCPEIANDLLHTSPSEALSRAW